MQINSKRLYNANQKHKKARVAGLLLSEIDFSTKGDTRYKEKHLMIIKGKIYKEKIEIMNVILDNRAQNYKKDQNERIKEMNNSTTIARLYLHCLSN